MKIELNKENDMLSLEGQGEIVLTRLTKENPIGITMKCDGAKPSVSNMYLVNLKGKTRVGRFLYALKHVWILAR
ncbi:hypothetical protein K0A21_23375 [Salmonella enterica subsp. enterica serovar Reading]|uniref:Uncharacterized protein n=1 Tax=Salmonella phage Akira TaxID=2562461 RepID=A0A4D6DYM2_9CAUD|nr:hypothetical protein KGB47_gp50 [Salmonella phage Akira]MCO9872098.1 hypothetical protein [Salmonella enterica subsp. enterica serovar Reading]MCP0078124.1 hypothetical protein [Salmonella enterica subsp. enterica serovar Reading]MCP0094697.1 hypothetical protein [Salmonella enterica subsp. enterica serovar Reading]MCP0424808.1 hypothetical protein [Salmonella enterica subsp. enterica serovar Reading]MCR3079953.1 hypothetical protein [Salmonella enterica subsp. enterica serovar Reading]